MDFSSILFLSAVLMMEQKASTVSPARRSSSSQLSSRPPHREKRCSCENLKDRECVYFCHIGIVWVNTPSQVIPYGVGFLQTRPRRHVERCFCTHPRDAECVTFCSYRGGLTSLRSSTRILKEHLKANEKERRSSS